MGKKYWSNGEKVKIVLDEENQKILLFAGGSAIEINGQDGKIALSGAIAEMNSGNRTEEILLKKEAGLLSVIPSTTFTPIPQATINIPVAEIGGMIKDISTMFSLLG